MQKILIISIILTLLNCKNNRDTVISKQSNDTEIYYKNHYARGWFVDSIASVSFDQASEESARGNHNSAKKLYERANHLEPDNKIILNALGNVSADLEDQEECIMYFNQSLKIDSTNSITYMNFGTAYNKLLEFEKSIEILKRGIEYENNEEIRGYFYYNLANSYYKLNDYKMSYEFVNKALSLVNEKSVRKDIIELKEVLSDLIN